MAKHLQYVTGYEDEKKNGRLELANELNQALFELKRNHTVVNISTVIQMIDNRKLIYKKIDGYIKKEEHQFLTNSEKRRCELTHNKRKMKNGVLLQVIILPIQIILKFYILDGRKHQMEVVYIFGQVKKLSKGL